jgi:predicted nucleic acid-binding protein
LAVDPRRVFVDTNVLVYAYDGGEPVRQPVAREVLTSLWQEGTGTLSTQVLQEFYHTVTRKVRAPMTAGEAREIVAAYSRWPVVVVDPALILAATWLQESQQLSFWDALIVEAARVGGAARLLTEDMQHGRVIDGTRIENPFAGTVGRDQSDDSRPAGGRR